MKHIKINHFLAIKRIAVKFERENGIQIDICKYQLNTSEYKVRSWPNLNRPVVNIFLNKFDEPLGTTTSYRSGVELKNFMTIGNDGSAKISREKLENACYIISLALGEEIFVRASDETTYNLRMRLQSEIEAELKKPITPPTYKSVRDLIESISLKQLYDRYHWLESNKLSHEMMTLRAMILRAKSALRREVNNRFYLHLRGAPIDIDLNFVYRVSIFDTELDSYVPFEAALDLGVLAQMPVYADPSLESINSVFNLYLALLNHNLSNEDF